MDFGGIRLRVDNVDQFLARVEALTGNEVLVGIPQERSARKDNVPINNATLAYIHENGSPAQNLPARPFLHPGIRKARDAIAAEFRKAALAALDGKPASQGLHRAGMVARNSVVKEITDPAPPFTPLSPVTIRARLRRTQAGRRKLMQLTKQGKPLGVWAQERNKAGNPNIRPLIDTGQLRAAITYVVRARSGGGGSVTVRRVKSYETGLIR